MTILGGWRAYNNSVVNIVPCCTRGIWYWKMLVIFNCVDGCYVHKINLN